MPDPPSSELPSPEGKESSFTGKSVEGIAGDDSLQHRSKSLELDTEDRKLEHKNEETKRAWRLWVFVPLWIVLTAWLLLPYVFVSFILFPNQENAEVLKTLLDSVDLDSPVIIAFISSQTILLSGFLWTAFRWLFGVKKEKKSKKYDLAELLPLIRSNPQ